MPRQTAYRALADPARREILWLVRDGGRPAAAIAAHLDVSVETTRRHLGLLVASGLVRADGDVYSLKTSVLSDVVLELAELAGIGTDVTRADLIEPVEV